MGKYLEASALLILIFFSSKLWKRNKTFLKKDSLINLLQVISVCYSLQKFADII